MAHKAQGNFFHFRHNQCNDEKKSIIKIIPLANFHPIILKQSAIYKKFSILPGNVCEAQGKPPDISHCHRFKSRAYLQHISKVRKVCTSFHFSVHDFQNQYFIMLSLSPALLPFPHKNCHENRAKLFD